MYSIEKIRANIVGIDKQVHCLDGSKRQYIFFDNGASTPSFKSTLEKVNEYLEWYSAVHRGNGIKSIVSTHAYEKAHEIIGDFVGYDKDYHTVVILKNTTEAVNKLSYRFDLGEDGIVLTTGMEHHSNYLPWKRTGRYDYVKVKEDGTLDMNDLVAKFEWYKDRIKLLAITGASNVSGLITQYHEAAEIAHKYGALILVDAAQLSPHRKINMLPKSDPRHIDFLVMSAHKIYAPYGAGVLVMPKNIIDKGNPEYVGGGNAKVVTHWQTHWHSGADKEEAGSPNAVGAVAFASSLKTLQEIGMDEVANHEIELTEHILRRFKEIPQIKTLIETDFDNIANRLGVITFNVDGFNYLEIAARLCFEYGIGLRSGRFCTQPYLMSLLKIPTDNKACTWVYKLLEGDKFDIPGALRISFGIYNTIEEIDYLIEALKEIIEKPSKFEYERNQELGQFYPKNINLSIEEYFSI
jgi:selenocysteine lyase/cysteine desulfurase